MTRAVVRDGRVELVDDALQDSGGRSGDGHHGDCARAGVAATGLAPRVGHEQALPRHVPGVGGDPARIHQVGAGFGDRDCGHHALRVTTDGPDATLPHRRAQPPFERVRVARHLCKEDAGLRDGRAAEVVRIGPTVGLVDPRKHIQAVGEQPAPPELPRRGRLLQRRGRAGNDGADRPVFGTEHRQFIQPRRALTGERNDGCRATGLELTRPGWCASFSRKGVLSLVKGDSRARSALDTRHRVLAGS